MRITNTINSYVKNTKLFYLGLFIIIVLLGLLLRFGSYGFVVQGENYNLQGADAYYFVGRANQIGEGGIKSVDEDLCYPQGQVNDDATFVYSFIVYTASLFTGSTASAAAYLSPILAMLSSAVIGLIVYILGKKNIAILAALITASFSGVQYWSRSYFGFGDRHVWEVFIFSLVILSFVYILKNIKKVIDTRKEILIFIASFAIQAVYILSWSGAIYILMLVYISFFIHQYLVSSSYQFKNISYILLPLGLFSLLVGYYSFALFAAIYLFAYLIFTQDKIKVKNKSYIYIFVGAVSILLLIIFNQALLQFINQGMSFFFGAANSSISETQPMWQAYRGLLSINISIVHWQFLFFVLSSVGLYHMYKKKQYFLIILAISVFMLAFFRIRMEYYLIPFMAIAIAFLVEKYRYSIVFVILGSIFFVVGFWQTISLVNQSGIKSDVDFRMARWMEENVDEGIILADWEAGYIYSELAGMPVVASPDLCNYKETSKIIVSQNPENAARVLKEFDVDYLVVKQIDLNRFIYHYSLVVNRIPNIRFAQVEDQTFPIIPAYIYKSIGYRLSEFNNQEVKSSNPIVETEEGLQSFENFEQAIEAGYTEAELLGFSPNSSPINIEAIDYFELIHTEEAENGASVKLYKVNL